MKKIILVVPTYNESENIVGLIDELLKLSFQSHSTEILVVDDNSPDGTARLVEEKSKTTPKVHLLLRTNDRGRGKAGIAGFKKALEMGADYIFELDADFSHDPKFLPNLVKALDDGADVVLGSRFIEGGSDNDRNAYRQLVSICAGIYVRTVLGTRIKDVSSGYRGFTRQALEKIEYQTLISQGPSIILEVLNRCIRKKLVLKEIPIVFIDRKLGETKLNLKTLLKTLLMVLKFRVSQ